MGRGAFEVAYTRVNATSTLTFSHLENEYLQAVVDWGIPGAAFLALAMGLLILSAIRRWQAGPLEAGALGGLAALALQNVADFNLEFPGVALPALALIATLLPTELAKPGSSHVARRPSASCG